MQLHEISFPSARPIDGYGPGFFRIDNTVYRHPVLVMATGISPWTGLEDSDALLALKDEVDVIILGTGAEIAHPPTALREALEGAGIGVEPMGTPAACRTFNVLLSEGRRIAAALIPV